MKKYDFYLKYYLEFDYIKKFHFKNPKNFVQQKKFLELQVTITFTIRNLKKKFRKRIRKTKRIIVEADFFRPSETETETEMLSVLLPNVDDCSTWVVVPQILFPIIWINFLCVFVVLIYDFVQSLIVK